MSKEQHLCDNCGAEYELKYDDEEILDEAMYCPFCGNELNSFDIEDEFDQELDLDDD